jgi:GTP-binding protein HflX
VNKVLDEIGASRVPQVLVLNQIDRVGMEPGLERDEYGRIFKVRVSAKTGEGLHLLRQVMAEHQQVVAEQSIQYTALA